MSNRYKIGQDEETLLETLEHPNLEALTSKPKLPTFTPRRSCPTKTRSRRRCFRVKALCWICRRVKVLLHYFLLILSGALYLAESLSSLISAISPDSLDWIAAKFQTPVVARPVYDGSDVFPIACHSHNDYWRLRPLYTALEYGCSAVEADIWLDTNGEVLVGHSQRALSPDRTLKAVYLEPLLEILDRNNPDAEEVNRYHRDGLGQLPVNGVFDAEPQVSLVLLIDFKNDSHNLWQAVYSELEPLRRKGYLTYYNGTTTTDRAVTLVASGDVPFESVIENTHYHDIFYDAPLELMSSDGSPTEQYPQAAIGSPNDQTVTTPLSPPSNPDAYNTTNSFYASVSFKASIGHPMHSSLTQAQMALMRSQIRGAHARGLKVRYWAVPSWPIGVRNYLWRVMVREGVDFLSVDDIRAVAKDNWGPRKGGWGKKWWY